MKTLKNILTWMTEVMVNYMIIQGKTARNRELDDDGRPNLTLGEDTIT